VCNACGFYCCAYDGFSGCGCDDCPERACWGDDEDFYDEDDYDFAALPKSRLHCYPAPPPPERRGG